MLVDNEALAIQRGNASTGLMNVQVVIPAIYTANVKVDPEIANTCIYGSDEVTSLSEMVRSAPSLVKMDAIKLRRHPQLHATYRAIEAALK